MKLDTFKTSSELLLDKSATVAPHMSSFTEKSIGAENTTLKWKLESFRHFFVPEQENPDDAHPASGGEGLVQVIFQSIHILMAISNIETQHNLDSKQCKYDMLQTDLHAHKQRQKHSSSCQCHAKI